MNERKSHLQIYSLKNGYQENFTVFPKKCGKTSCNVVWLLIPALLSKMSVVELVFDGSLASLSNNRNLESNGDPKNSLESNGDPIVLRLRKTCQILG